MAKHTESLNVRWAQVVILILLGMLLVVLLWPTSQQQRSLARRANCTTNLKQVGIAMAMYADLYHQRLPMDQPEATLVGSLQLLSNFVGSATILACPMDSRVKPRTDFAGLTSRNISYSYVPNLIWQNGATNTIVALDRIYTTAAGSAWPSDGNHGANGGNVLFNSSYVQFFKRLPSAVRDKDGKEIVLSP
jgi:Protein of unknown function (DUF1559)